MYNDEFRKQVVTLVVVDRHRPKEVAEQMNISVTTVNNWVKAYGGKPVKAKQAQPESLYQKVLSIEETLRKIGEILLRR